MPNTISSAVKVPNATQASGFVSHANMFFSDTPICWIEIKRLLSFDSPSPAGLWQTNVLS
jgi:hypothetical protein